MKKIYEILTVILLLGLIGFGYYYFKIQPQSDKNVVTQNIFPAKHHKHNKTSSNGTASTDAEDSTLLGMEVAGDAI